MRPATAIATPVAATPAVSHAATEAAIAMPVPDRA